MEANFKIQYARDEIINKCCSKCKRQFIFGQLIMIEMIQSKNHDGKDPVWSHSQCFFASDHLIKPQDIDNFENIKYDDQLKILSRLDPKSSGKFEKLFEINKTEQKSSHKNFSVEYASSNNEKCAKCQESIDRTEIRIKSINYNSAKFGKEIRWAHLHCFVFNREEYDFLWDGKMLEGFSSLQKDHQEFVAECLPEIVKVEIKSKSVEENLEMKIARQTSEFIRVRQSLQEICSKEELHLLLVMNDYSLDGDDFDLLLDRCSDILTFGSLYKCQKCFRGDMVFSKYGYSCNAWINEWVKCDNFDTKPLRMKCFIPDELKDKEFFATCEPKAEDRAVRKMPIQENSVEKQDVVKKQINQKARIRVKEGTVVDPQSNLSDMAHVYLENSTLYNCVLGLTDIQRNKNSFYKLQVLESDNKKNFWLFTSWGRTGTEIGSFKVQPFQTAQQTTAEFEKIYEEQTGNSWKLRENFRRVPGKFYPIDVNYNDEIIVNTKAHSRLSPQVKDLMKLLFNVANMQESMQEFELDLEKLPLGKLSAKHLEEAYFALAELEQAVTSGGSRNELIGLSNKFFTLIPHNFGLDTPPVLDSVVKIDEKREIIDSLFDIADAYLMVSQVKDTKINSFDAYYLQLNATVEYLSRDSQEFKLIEKYLKNSSTVNIVDAFKIQRNGENERFSAYSNLDRQLLWHGSRIVNFASIIKNGLRICQPAHGSMFGRGIYFADMACKSIGYSDGLLALCEVALGNIYAVNGAQNFTSPPVNYHSVKGNGQTQPNLQEAYKTQDGVLIPLGQPIHGNRYGRLAYNEFIVYSETQIKIKYLIKF